MVERLGGMVCRHCRTLAVPGVAGLHEESSGTLGSCCACQRRMLHWLPAELVELAVAELSALRGLRPVAAVGLQVLANVKRSSNSFVAGRGQCIFAA